MVGILVHGDNHFIVRGRKPDRATALALIITGIVVYDLRRIVCVVSDDRNLNSIRAGQQAGVVGHHLRNLGIRPASGSCDISRIVVSTSAGTRGTLAPRAGRYAREM